MRAKKSRKIVPVPEFSAAPIHIKFLVIYKKDCRKKDILSNNMVKKEKICEFIFFVHSNPALYSKSDAEYKNNDIKNALWKKAANEFGMKGFLFDKYE